MQCKIDSEIKYLYLYRCRELVLLVLVIRWCFATKSIKIKNVAIRQRKINTSEKRSRLQKGLSVKLEM
jgi:hypothetical protein